VKGVSGFSVYRTQKVCTNTVFDLLSTTALTSYFTFST